MKKFKFYQDELVKIWRRSVFEIEANSKEEAVEKIKELNLNNEDLDSIGEFDESEYLYDSVEVLKPGEVIKGSTVEIEDADTFDVILSNKK